MPELSEVQQVLANQANDALVKEFTSEKKLPVIEIFGPTIQGEGPLSGTKTMFVRFGGCDYRCQKCDSLHAVDPRAVKKFARRMTQSEIFEELLSKMEETGTEWVTLSGGNPAMWDLKELKNLIQSRGYYVAVETQGTLCPDWLTAVNMVVVSPKSPGMGEKFEGAKFEAFLEKLRGRVHIALKVVVFSAQDMEFALALGDTAQRKQAIPRGMRFMSLGNPYPPKLTEDLVVNSNIPRGQLPQQLLQQYRILLDDFLVDPRITDWKFMPQMHVLVWGNDQGY